MDPTYVLAHELIHAYHEFVTKTYDDGDTVGLTEEGCTVCAENQIRQELTKQERCTYDSTCVACNSDAYNDMLEYEYDCRLLPTGSEYLACGCGKTIWETILTRLKALIEWTNRLMARLAQLFRAPRPRPAGDGRILQASGFVDLTPDEPDLARAFEQSLRSLVRGRRKWGEPRVESVFETSTDALVLEILHVQGGYRVVLIARGDEGSTIITNIEAGAARGRPLATQGALVERPLSPTVADTVSEISADPVIWKADGQVAGVNPRVADGASYFLRVKSEGRVHRVAARGFRFPVAATAETARPQDAVDGARWDAIQRARQFASEQLLQIPEEDGATLKAFMVSAEPAPGPC
jgi:hypothetical protein